MRTCRTVLLPLALAATLLGCGGSDPANEDTTPVAGAGALVHVDGTIVMEGDGFVLQPKTGDEAITFAVGAEVQPAGLRAFEAAKTPVRVSYRLTTKDPIAVAVGAAPSFEGLEAYVGKVTAVDETSIELDGGDGVRRFTIAAADSEAFDTPHLRDHERQGTLIKVYFNPKQPGAGVAYEDA